MARDVTFKNRDRFIQLGIMIATLRKMRGMSQEELAEKAGISRSHLSSIEAPNKAYPFSLEVFYNLVDALEVEASDLIDVSMLADKISDHSKGESETSSDKKDR